jgi:two-component system, cell cycle sensor histidine kinase and response regulator CckA
VSSYRNLVKPPVSSSDIEAQATGATAARRAQAPVPLLRKMGKVVKPGIKSPKQSETRLNVAHREVASMTAKDVQQLVQELQIQQIELETQNEELQRTQGELEAVRDRYVNLYDYSPASHLTLDRDGKIVEANLTAATILDTDRRALIGHPLAEFIGEADRETFRLHWQKVLKSERRLRCEVPLRNRGGAVRTVAIESCPVQHKAGRIIRWQAILLDITERKQAEEKALQLAERLDLATKSAELGVWDWNIQKNELHWDDRMFTLYGVRKETFGGAYEAWLSGVHPDDRARCDEAIQQALRMEKPYDVEFRICWPSGTVRTVKADGQVIWGMDGTALRMIGVNYDITERKLNEDGLREAKEHLQMALRSSNTGIWEWDAETEHIYFSKEAMAQLGYEEHELVNSVETWTGLLHDDDRDRILTSLQAYRENPSGNYRQEFRLRHKDGSYRWIASTASFVYGPGGRRKRLFGCHTDITERKQLESQFYQAQKMEAVGRFAASVAHDFNNLLTVINGYTSQLLDQLPPEDPRHKMVVETLGAGERAGALTKQLLGFSRRQVLKLEPIDLNDSIRSISSMLEPLLGEDVTLTLDLAQDLWSVGADKGQLDQVVMNLAVNARDAMPDGGTLTITTSNVKVTAETPDPHGIMQPGHYVKLCLSDTGQGMSPETKARLFEPFFTTKELGKGTGLGLATVYGIVKQSQGYIFVDSALDQGTTFYLYYPRTGGAPVVAGASPVGSTRSTERLLVVEDKDSVRSLIVGILIREGYRVIEAANGIDALRTAASLSEPVHGLVTDVIMPQMTGLVLAERLRKVWPDLPVFFMSGYSGIDMSAMLGKPGVAFIQKPFLPKDLVQRLREFLDRDAKKA